MNALLSRPWWKWVLITSSAPVMVGKSKEGIECHLWCFCTHSIKEDGQISWIFLALTVHSSWVISGCYEINISIKEVVWFQLNWLSSSHMLRLHSLFPSINSNFFHCLSRPSVWSNLSNANKKRDPLSTSSNIHLVGQIHQFGFCQLHVSVHACYGLYLILSHLTSPLLQSTQIVDAFYLMQNLSVTIVMLLEILNC